MGSPNRDCPFLKQTEIQIGIWRYYGQEKVLDNPIVLCAFYNVRICCNTSLWNNKCSPLIWLDNHIYMLSDGIHKAIISEELWNQVHKKDR